MTLDELQNVVTELAELARKLDVEPKHAVIEEIGKEHVRMRIGKLTVISRPGTFKYATSEGGV